MRRLARSVASIGATTLVLMPATAQAVAPSVATLDVAAGVRLKPFGAVTGECTAKLLDTDGATMSVLVTGTAQSEGPVAATEIACTIYQDPDVNLVYDTARGGCSAAMPLNVAACAAIVRGVPLAPFRVCAVATAHDLSGGETTGVGPSCPR